MEEERHFKQVLCINALTMTLICIIGMTILELNTTKELFTEHHIEIEHKKTLPINEQEGLV